MQSKLFTIGCDPELFWQNAAGKLISCIGKVGGSKEFPKALGYLGAGYAVQEDNVAAEFNIPPCDSRDAFVRAITLMLNELGTMAHKQGFLLAINASGVFENDQLNCAKAHLAGCDPDFNAWDIQDGMPAINPRPDLSGGNLRSCGGHVAVGHRLPPITMIRAQDLFLGVPSVLIDKDVQRRQLYGKAGCFRPTPFGSEYRTLSNFWLKSPELTGWVYDQTARALAMASEYVEGGGDPEMFLTHERMAIESAINGGNLDAVNGLTGRFGLTTVRL